MAGARITREKMPLLDEMARANAYADISQSEGCAIHRDRMKRRAADIDPNVRARIELGYAYSAADYVDMIRTRGNFARAMDERLAGLDALIVPTTPIVAPTIAEMTDQKVYMAGNAALLRNTAFVNFCDLCAISLPLPAPLPVGLMLVARHRHDHRLLRIAAATAELFRA